MSMWIIGISTVVSVVGTAVSVDAQMTAAKSAENIAEHNAKVDLQASQQESLVAAENARRKSRENAKIIGLQKEAMAASGLAPTGTPLAMLGETVLTLERDLMDMGYEAATRSAALRSSAEMSLVEGRAAAGAARQQAVATGISGLGSASSGYIKASGAGAPKTS